MVDISPKVKIKNPTITIKTITTRTVEGNDPSCVPVVEHDGTLVGMLHIEGERPEMYSKFRNVHISKQVGHNMGDVFTIPKRAKFVCFAEESIVYLLPGYSEEDDAGLEELIIPVYSQFYEISECTVQKTTEVRYGQ